MEPDELKERNFENEFVFSATRSSGPGGQNVNKVSSRIELRFNIKETRLFSEEEKLLLFKKLEKRINREGEIIIVSQSERSQFANRTEAVERFYKLISRSLTVQKKRKKTTPNLASKLKRLDDKHKKSTKKKLRKDSGIDTDQ
ncbi:MAG TPA: alternative ribosome rescue aminoacyl-tRNA hydrolase ArfB [Bacteroidales bacterium]|nr:alternative ribosome rescue aminoacyl-tRNA hydrolase ArfB [Bacteroidales bacterium]